MHEEPFHDGEVQVQERAGERALADRVAPMLSDAIVPGAWRFLAGQRMVALGTVDGDGMPWASLLFGEPGFASTADGASVTIDLTRATVDRRDALWSNARVGGPLGLLAIDLASRRRLRVNGTVTALTDASIALAVREAYPNCPKYIQRRVVHTIDGATDEAATEMATGVALDDARQRHVERADTLFVASHHPVRGADVSHRGGEPGFARLIGRETLRIPDYRGNSLFNTLGNLAVVNRAGLLVPDFERGRALQLAGEVTLQFDVPDDPRQPAGGTGRYWDLQVSRWVELPLPSTLRWALLDASPFNPSREQDGSSAASTRARGPLGG